MSGLDSSAPNGFANACLKSPLEHSSYAVAPGLAVASAVPPTAVPQTSSLPTLFSNPAEPPPHREALRVLLIGTRSGVTGTIQTLYRLGFAQVSDWSPLLPAPTPGEVMSILTRYILTVPSQP